jgi:hypothetical protein
MKHDYSQKNSERRREKGLLNLPEYSTIKVSGKLRVYVDEYNLAFSQGRRIPTYSWQVGNHNVYFWNKKRYHNLYELKEDELEKRGFKIDNDLSKGIIYKLRKGSVRGSGPLIERVHKVVKD